MGGATLEVPMMRNYSILGSTLGFYFGKLEFGDPAAARDIQAFRKGV